MRKWLSLLLFVFGFSLFYLTGMLYQKRIDRFSIASIQSNRVYNAKWESRSLSQEEAQTVESALDQDYSYYGCGGQSFIFFSKDDRFVLKFFKQKNFTTPKWLDYLPIPYLLNRYKAKKRWKRADKLNRDFTSYKTAFDTLPHLTGVVYLHLNKTTHLNKKLTITDPLHIAHTLDLNAYDFIIQRKAEYVYDRISNAMKEGNEAKAKDAISKIIGFIVTRCKLGYHDRDPNIRTNCGFIDGELVKIDVGRITYMEEIKELKNYTKELVRITKPFKEWLTKTYPSLLDHFEKELQTALQE
jgi:hypothetical protein